MNRAIIVAPVIFLAFAGCTFTNGGGTTPTTIVQKSPADYAADILLIAGSEGPPATGLTSVLDALEKTPGVSSADVAKVQGAVAQIKAVASAISASPSATSPTSAQQVADLVHEVGDVVLPLALPGAQGAAIKLVFDAAQTLVPIVLQASGATAFAAATPDSAENVATARSRLAQGVNAVESTSQQ